MIVVFLFEVSFKNHEDTQFFMMQKWLLLLYETNESVASKNGIKETVYTFCKSNKKAKEIVNRDIKNEVCINFLCSLKNAPKRS